MADTKKFTATVTHINTPWVAEDKSKSLHTMILTATDPKTGEDKPVPFEIKYWSGDEFASQVAVGKSLEIEHEKRPAKNGGKEEHWAVSINGIAAKKPGARGGGGGARTYTPKSREEIHGPGISGIIKSCIENGISTEQAREWLKLYSTECANYQTVTSGRPGAS